MLRDHTGIVHIFGRMKFERRIVLQIRIQLERPHRKTRDDFAGVNGLLRVRDHATLHEINHAVPDHLRMDTEILVIDEQRQYGIGDFADAELKRGAVRNEGSDMTSDGRRDRAGRLGNEFDKLMRVLDERVDVAHVHERISVHARHRTIHFGDHGLRRLHSGHAEIRVDPETAIPVLVGGRNHDERAIERHLARSEQRGDLAQKDGRVVSPAFVDRIADIAPDKERVMMKTLCVVAFTVRRHPEREKVYDFDITQLIGPVHESPREFLRNRAPRAQIDPVAGSDAAARLQPMTSVSLRIPSSNSFPAYHLSYYNVGTRRWRDDPRQAQSRFGFPVWVESRGARNLK